MAEAAAAFGVAAGVFQPVDFGGRLTSKLWELYRDNKSATNETLDITTTTEDLENILANIEAFEPPGSAADESEGLWLLAREFRGIAKEMLGKLHSLSAQSDGQFLGVGGRLGAHAQAAKVALKTVWEEAEVKKLVFMPCNIQGASIITDIFHLRYEARKTTQQQDAVLSQLAQLTRTTERLEQLTLRKDQKGKTAIPFGSRMLELLIPGSQSDRERLDLKNALLQNLLEKNMNNNNEYTFPEVPKQRLAILRKKFFAKLQYSGMLDRGQIAPAYQDTFKWIFDETASNTNWSSLTRWLRSDNQLYWITGKAGSGKSTLMKYISDSSSVEETSQEFGKAQPLCQQYLEHWSHDTELAIACFYFWNSGTALQMSRSGLFRFLLHEVLTKWPDMIPLLAPRQWEALCLFDHHSEIWTDEELHQMAMRIPRFVSRNRKLCFFIDGLDEFDGDHKALIELIEEFLKASNIKVCVASRPWVVFEDAFKSAPSLMVQDLTSEDIKHYVTTELQNNDGFAELRELEPVFAENLTTNIVSKAEGVFLWIKLVVASLLSGMQQGDRLTDIQRRLDLLPPELEDLYEKILVSLDPFYLDHTAQYFSMIEASFKPLELMVMSFADEDNAEFALNLPIRPLSARATKSRESAMRRRLNSRCKGLLEVSMSSSIGILEHPGTVRELSIVQYLHRTVRDFVKSPRFQSVMTSSIDQSFDAKRALALGCLARAKTIQTSSLRVDPAVFDDSMPNRAEVLVGNFFGYIERLKHKSGRAMFRYIDEMMRTIDNYASTSGSLSFYETIGSHGSHGSHGSQYLSNWLSTSESYEHKIQAPMRFPVHYGLFEYVSSRLSKDFKIKASPTEDFPLLLWAVSPDTLHHQMLEKMLRGGADPNLKNLQGNLTVWTKFIRDISYVFINGFDKSLGRGKLQVLAQLRNVALCIMHFIQNGACMSRKHPDDENILYYASKGLLACDIGGPSLSVKCDEMRWAVRRYAANIEKRQRLLERPRVIRMAVRLFNKKH